MIPARGLRCLLILTGLIFCSVSFSQHKLDFGIALQQNNNLVKKFASGNAYSPQNFAFSMRDRNGDTLNMYLNTFEMENNYEIPVFLRYTYKNRWFTNLSLSNSFHILRSSGVSNYNRSYFVRNYGTYNVFADEAAANGFPNVTMQDYENYLTARQAENEVPIENEERFKLLTASLMGGYKFLPHKAIRPFVGAGFSYKIKYNKVLYQYLDIDHPNVKNYLKMNEGLNQFAKTTGYVNFTAGLEYYRFRLSAYYQTGALYNSSSGKTNNLVIAVNPYTPYDKIHSYGFLLAVDLATREKGPSISSNGLTFKDEVQSNVRRKQEKWNMGIRYDRRGITDLQTYYGDSTHRLNVLTRDSVLLKNGMLWRQSENIEVLSLGEVKNIDWTGQLGTFYTRNFGRRWSASAALGVSNLRFDVETTQLKATVMYDSAGNGGYFEYDGTPQLRSAVFRKGFTLVNLSLGAGYNIISTDGFSLRASACIGQTKMIDLYRLKARKTKGVNDLAIYGSFDRNYGEATEPGLYAYEGPMDVKLVQPAQFLLSEFPDQDTRTMGWPRKVRYIFPTATAAIDANIDRFSIGLSMEMPIDGMDNFMLRDFRTINLSMGYRIFSR